MVRTTLCTLFAHPLCCTMTTSSPRRSAAARCISEQALFDRDGRLNFEEGFTLYKHPGSSFIYADYRPMADKRSSTRATNVEQAKAAARRRLKELLRRQVAGLPITTPGPSVADLLHAYLRTLQTLEKQGDQTLKPEISVLERNFLPFWSRVPLSDIGRHSFLEWVRWRKEQAADSGTLSYQRGGKTVTMSRRTKSPSRETLLREKSRFVRALAWGSDQNPPWLTDEAVHEIRHLPQRQKRTVKHLRETEQRDALDRDELSKLLVAFESMEERERKRVRLKGEAGRRKNYQRRLMAVHVRLLFASGLRPGKEILQLTWESIQIECVGQTRIIVINRCGSGKTGPRMVNCDPAAVQVIDDLRRLHAEFGFAILPTATLWPSTRGQNSIVQDFNGSFKTTVRRLKLNERVQDEPLYICRHTYITDHLRQGISSDVLATNCGTSVEMIERHYKHLKSEQIRDKLLPPLPPGGLQLATSDPFQLPIGLHLDKDGLLRVRQ